MKGWCTASSTALHQHRPDARHSRTTQGSSFASDVIFSASCFLPLFGQEYLKDWHPRLIGLTGTPEQVYQCISFIDISFMVVAYSIEIVQPCHYLYRFLRLHKLLAHSVFSFRRRRLEMVLKIISLTIG